MIRKITVMSLLILSSCSTNEPVFAQQPQSTYVPIVLDAPKFDAFYNALTEVSMPQKSFQSIVTLLQGLERQAQQEKAQADAAAAVAAEIQKGTDK